MKLNELSKAELEAMSYDDIALKVLEESNKQMKINELFKEVCNLLALSEDEFVAKLPAFFDVLTTDHRFIMLENGLWDLKTKHATKIIIDSDEEEDIDEEIELEDIEESDELTDEDENIFADDDSDDDLTDDDDDLKDLVIIDEDEEQMA